MLSQSSDAKPYQEVVQRHRALKGLLRDIGEMLDLQSARVDEVADLLGLLGDRLIKHFETEEAGGYFAEALTEAPQLISRANELLVQHPKMTQKSRDLSGCADPDTEPELWMRQTKERFDEFHSELLKHESQEDRLLQEAYTRYLGLHD